MSYIRFRVTHRLRINVHVRLNANVSERGKSAGKRLIAHVSPENSTIGALRSFSLSSNIRQAHRDLIIRRPLSSIQKRYNVIHCKDCGIIICITFILLIAFKYDEIEQEAILIWLGKWKILLNSETSFAFCISKPRTD